MKPSASCSPLTPSETGVTAPELLVVVAIVAVMAAIAMPNLTRLLESDRLSAASREVISQLRMAQSLAVKSGQFHRFATDPGQPNRYRIELSANNATWPLPTDTVASTAATVPRVSIDWLSLASEYPGITMPNANTVPFDFRGAVATSGGSVLIGLAGSTGIRTITVNHAGGISVQ